MQSTQTLPCFKLKGSHYTLTSLQLLDLTLEELDEQLSDKVKQAPKFFNNTPIVIDLQIIADKGNVDLGRIIECLRKHQMIPIGVQGGRAMHDNQAKELGLAILPQAKAEAKQKEEKDKQKFNHAKIINHPIRSGQQVYAQGGDLVIIGAVGAGAECLADGNIHVYGPLRGRALAGILGDTSAHIFCQRLEAELVSIAGQYRVSEHLKEGIWNQAADIHITDGHFNINPM